MIHFRMLSITLNSNHKVIVSFYFITSVTVPFVGEEAGIFRRMRKFFFSVGICCPKIHSLTKKVSKTRNYMTLYFS